MSDVAPEQAPRAHARIVYLGPVSPHWEVGAVNHENRMTTLDAGFLQAEDSDPHVSLAIGGLAVLTGPVPEQSALLSTLGERMAACPRFKQRVRVRPLDIGPPEWVDDDDFDVADHVRRIGVPAPGGESELHALVFAALGEDVQLGSPPVAGETHALCASRPIGHRVLQA